MDWFVSGFVLTAVLSSVLVWLFWDRQESAAYNACVLFFVTGFALLVLELDYSFHLYWDEREKELLFQTEACSDTFMVERHERQQDACRSSRLVTGKSFGRLVNERVYLVLKAAVDFLSRNALAESVTPAFIQLLILIILFSLILVVSRSYVDADRGRSDRNFENFKNAVYSTEMVNTLLSNGKRLH